MATVTIGTVGGTMTAAQLKTALDNAIGADLTRQGHANSRTFRCVDNLVIQGDVTADGFTFVCANAKSVTFSGSSASPGVIRTAVYVDGSPFLPLRIIYEGETPFGEHDVTRDTQGILRHCGADIGRLEIVISGDSSSNYFGMPFLTSQKVVIKELSISNQCQSGLLYTNFHLTHAESMVRLACLRNSTIRISASFDFGFTGDQGWAFGEQGWQKIKMLSPNNSLVSGLAPKFSDSSGVIELTSPDFTATTRIFRDSYLSPSRITMHPLSNDSAVTEIERTVVYNPLTPSGGSLSSIMARVISSRTVTGSPGVSAGVTLQHAGAISSGATQVFRVWKGFNAGGGSGAYHPATKVIDDSAITVTYRRADLIESSVNISGYTGPASGLATMGLDSNFSGTMVQAAAVSGIAFAHDSAASTVAVTVSQAVTGQDVYNFWKHWTSQAAQMGSTLVPQNLVAVNNGVLTITGSITTSEAVSAGGNVVSIKATGSASATGSGSYSLPIEDSSGVRVTVTKSGGGSFNILAKRMDTGVELGYSSSVSTVTYTVPRGTSVEIAMWASGYKTLYRTISTSNGGVSYAAELVANPVIDTSLDVSAQVDAISLTLDTSGYHVVFGAAMSIDIESIKAIVHQLAGQQVSLRSVLSGGDTTIEILQDEIKINSPSVFLERGSALTISDRVELNGYINTAPAKAVTSSYVINPSDSSGLYVSYLTVKPELDPALLATAVRATIERGGGMLAQVQTTLDGLS